MFLLKRYDLHDIGQHNAGIAGLLTVTPIALQVIKALYDYQPDAAYPQELGFTKGDFFHVISREDDTDWYEACNPLIPTARGLVPVSYFEVIGKNERESVGSMPSRASTGGNDSGYSENGMHNRSDSGMTARAPNSAPLQRSTTSATRGPMVYGVMKYDFFAERPDELSILEGKEIILIAQSDPRWFVAKPIAELGGPGLVPTEYVGIYYMTSGKAVEPRNDEESLKDASRRAVQEAGIPRVEEWKRMTADYKDSSIELGRFTPASGAQGMQNGMERMSLSSQRRPNRANNDTAVSKVLTQSGPGSPLMTCKQVTQNGAYDYQQNGHRPTQPRDSTATLLAPIAASIPRYCFEHDKYWYIIECVLEDGRHWELARYYENFYDFQVALLKEFPEEAGGNNRERILPYMPGPVTVVTDAISNGRRESLNNYIKALLALPPRISKCYLVRQLFAPREGDYELDPRHVGEDYRLSGVSQQSSLSNTLSRTTSRRSSRSQTNGTTNGYSAQTAQVANGLPSQPRPSQPRAQASFANSQNSQSQTSLYRTPSTDVHRSPSISQQRQPNTAYANNANQSQSSFVLHNPTGAVTIKVFFESECFRIRIPATISYPQLRTKIVDRIQIQDEFRITYKNELTGKEDIEVRGDEDVGWVLDPRVNPKAILYVDFA